MSTINGLNQFLVPAQDAFLYQLVYNQVYGGRTGCTVNINGTTVQMGANSSIDILVETISGGTGCLLSGDRPYVYGDSPQYKYVPQTFVSVWDTSRTSTGSSTATRITLPLISTGSYNFIVEWGDGSTDRITTWNQAEVTHTYAAAGVYQLTITGTINGFRFNNTGDRLKLLSIFKWGTGFRLGATDAHFNGCSNLSLSEVEDVLNLAGTTNFNNLFQNCTNLTSIGYSNMWDTSNITIMSFMFNVTGGVGKFNSDISTWDISKVTTFRSAFQNQPEFNSDISTKEVTVNGRTYLAWDTLEVTDFQFMLNAGNATALSDGKFNQPIGNWNTSKATNMTVMFQNHFEFNQDINTKVVTVGNKTYTAWDTSNVTNMAGMFSANNSNLPLKLGKFNKPIGNWNTSKVTAINGMFQRQQDFNQDINTKVVTVGASTYTAWDTLNVTTMSTVFGVSTEYGSFNQPLGNWNTSKVTTMAVMFQNQRDFNQDINTKVVTVGASTYTAWDTLNVTTMSNMFGGDTLIPKKFNQPLGNWNTSRVTTMTQMFKSQNEFNQNIGTQLVTVGASTYSAWTVSAVTNMVSMFFVDPNFNNGLTGSFNNSGSTSINNWDMRRVTGATDMFNYQIAFNQPINNWNISGVTTFSSTGATQGAQGFMFGKTSNDYSSSNYDALLISWATRNVRPNQLLNMGTIKYSSAAVSARATLTSAPNNWTIVDGGLI